MNYLEKLLSPCPCPCILISFFLCLTQTHTHNLDPDIWFVSAERFQTTHHHHWSELKEKCMAVFPPMIYSQVNESIKRLSVTGRMGELWASGSHAALALGTLGGPGACHDAFTHRTVTLFMDSPGCAWACDLWLSIWRCGGIVVDTWS